MTLRDPDTCPRCEAGSRIVDTRLREARIVKGQPIMGYRFRRHECRACRVRWTTWETVVHPKRLRTQPVVVSARRNKESA